MSASAIQSKIKAGLAKAVGKVGSATVDKVYIVVNSGGSSDPLNPIAPTETDTELVNAIFTAYDINLIGGNIQNGDRMLITDNIVYIPVGATIKQGSTKYTVISVGPVAPTSEALLYKSQLRVK
tara:strand:- start:9781 stop:10152 length:372 start_codon:yes stop_codon:yes gene_type:complete